MSSPRKKYKPLLELVEAAKRGEAKAENQAIRAEIESLRSRVAELDAENAKLKSALREAKETLETICTFSKFTPAQQETNSQRTQSPPSTRHSNDNMDSVSNHSHGQ